MRFSLIAATFALALTVNASQISKREVQVNAARCTGSIKAISDYLPSFASSIKKVRSYTGVIHAHIKEDRVEKMLSKAIRDCNKVTSGTDEDIQFFAGVLEDLAVNIKDVTDALISKHHLLEEIPLAKPLLEDGLSTIYADVIYLEDFLFGLSPEEHKEQFQAIIDALNTPLKEAMDKFEVKY